MRNKKFSCFFPGSTSLLLFQFFYLLPSELCRGMGRVGCGPFIAIYLSHSFFILFCCSVGLLQRATVLHEQLQCGSFARGLDCSSVSSHMGSGLAESMGSPQAEASFRAWPPAEVWGPQWAAGGCLLPCHLHELQGDTHGHLCGLQETLEHLFPLLPP